ncbi:hypothetical protein [Nakamurella endophytica]|uniref:hypothetical protein n=1 Tax=Nakamurella endophytica TaxID=1748367 RepID=UPI00166AF39E|nr:hypothetical protein [Nakamurella endophytica]
MTSRSDILTAAATPTDPPARRPLAARIMSNPVIGFAPWILLSILEGPGRLQWAVGAVLALSVAFVVVDRLLGNRTKLLGVVDVVSFTAFLVLALTASPSVLRWLETWFGELTNVLLVLVVLGSILARTPFTIQYAKEETDPEVWNTPTFRHINYTITAVWGGAFLVAAIAGFVGDAVLHDNDNLWTGWIFQIGASLIALQFTTWYPEHATAVRLRAAGVPTEPPAPLTELFLPIVGYLVPIGVIVLVFGGGPTWLGIALLVVGLLGTARIRAYDRARKLSAGS